MKISQKQLKQIIKEELGKMFAAELEKVPEIKKLDKLPPVPDELVDALQASANTGNPGLLHWDPEKKEWVLVREKGK